MKTIHASCPATYAAACAKTPAIHFVYADWCPHCIHMKPVWHAFLKMNPTIHTISVDLQAFQDARSRHDVGHATRVQYHGVPLVFKIDKTGKISYLDDFIQKHGGEGRTLAMLVGFSGHKTRRTKKSPAKNGSSPRRKRASPKPAAASPAKRSRPVRRKSITKKTARK